MYLFILVTFAQGYSTVQISFNFVLSILYTIYIFIKKEVDG